MSDGDVPWGETLQVNCALSGPIVMVGGFGDREKPGGREEKPGDGRDEKPGDDGKFTWRFGDSSESAEKPGDRNRGRPGDGREVYLTRGKPGDGREVYLALWG